MKLTNEDIQEILDLLDATKFNVLQLQTERFKLTLRRHTGDGKAASEWSQESESLASPQILPTATATPSVAETKPSHAASPASTAGASGISPIEDPGTIAVRASLPGTFYRAPRPGAAPFVEVSAPVKEDTVVGIIETMKLMNAIHAGACGTITEILIPNASFAEQGSVLMRIKPDPA
jgi:acetyl-CoA carboxylase biotin carboxyl carrier protein